MVEFALIAPLFFGTVFAIAEGGLLLYIYNSAQNAATHGSLVIAAEGNLPAADADAITYMRTKTDFGLSGLISIKEYDVRLLASDGSNVRDTMSCAGAPCVQMYDAGGAVIAGSNWDPSLRLTDAASAQYVELDIVYDYHYFVTPGSMTLQVQRYFRLEPQSS